MASPTVIYRNPAGGLVAQAEGLDDDELDGVVQGRVQLPQRLLVPGHGAHAHLEIPEKE